MASPTFQRTLRSAVSSSSASKTSLTFKPLTRFPSGHRKLTSNSSQTIQPTRTAPFQSTHPSIAIRHASTIPATPSADSTKPGDVLTWDRFFDLRKKRRWINLGASVVTGLSAVAVGLPVIAQQDIDSWGAQISGIDPIIVLGGATIAVGGLGWLCGPTFGSSAFSLWAGRRGWNQLMAQKEKSFYDRIKRYRADASVSSPQNPPPDYYGEKIGSVKDYRRWLKDQRAFVMKRTRGRRTGNFS